jgi:hypothetical protein
VQFDQKGSGVGQVTGEFTRAGGGRVLLVLAALVGAAIVAACQERQEPSKIAFISGRLTLEGRPMVPGFSVVFMEPRRGDLAFGTTDADGRFRIDSWKKGEMVPGTYRAYVMAPPIEGFSLDEAFDRSGRNENAVRMPVEYPQEYGSVETTPLEYKVVTGQNHFDIDLKRTLDEPPESPPSETPAPK